MRKRFAALVALIALFALAAAPAYAITWGAPDTDNNYPYVGTLLFKQGDGLYSCSGTLMSPTVVLTAGHCLEGGDVVNEATWVSFEQTATFDGIENYATVEEFLDASPLWIEATPIPHPQYSDYAEFPNTYDVGVAVLETPVDLPTYGELPELGLLDRLATGQGRKDRQFTAVGYGSQGILKPITVDEYARYVGLTSLIELKSNSNGEAQSAKFTNNPGKGNGSGGTCFGDSGGPLFWGGTNVVGAIVSWGITPCIGVDYQFRVDTAVAQDFLRQYIP